MPKIEDFVNNLTFQSLEHPLGALVTLADERLKREEESRRYSEKLDLLREEGKIHADTAKELQAQQEKFLERQNELNRQNELAKQESMNKAHIAALTAAEKAKLEALHPRKPGESDEDWHDRVGAEQAKPVNGLVRQIESLHNEQRKLLQQDNDQRMAASAARAAGDVRVDPEVIKNVSSAAKKLLATNTPIDAIVEQLKKSKRDADANLIARTYQSLTDKNLNDIDPQTKQHVIPQDPTLKARIDTLTNEIAQKHQYVQDIVRQPGFLGMDKVNFGDALQVPPAGRPGSGAAFDSEEAARSSLAPLVAPGGGGNTAAIARILGGGGGGAAPPGAGGAKTAVAPGAGGAADAAEPAAPGTAVGPFSPQANWIQRILSGIGGIGVGPHGAGPTISELPGVLAQAGDTAFDAGANAVLGGWQGAPPPPVRPGRPAPFQGPGQAGPMPAPAAPYPAAPSPSMPGIVMQNLFAGAVPDTGPSPSRAIPERTTPQVAYMAARIWGPDAPSLLSAAKKFSDANGISEDEQTQTFNAALGGDPTAQQRVANVLNWLRAQGPQAPKVGMGNMHRAESYIAPYQEGTQGNPYDVGKAIENFGRDPWQR